MWIAVAIVATAIALRCSFDDVRIGDSFRYLRLAENMVQNFCYSASPVANGQCVPTWSAQPPGYPVFIAMTQSLTMTSDRSIIIGQTIIFFVAALYFAR